MSFPELNSRFPAGEVGFLDETEDVGVGFVDRKHTTPLKPSNIVLPMGTAQVQSVGHIQICLGLDVDLDSEEPYIFGEPLNPATNFAWDLPEAHFRKEVQMHRDSVSKTSSSSNVTCSRHLPDLSDANSTLNQQLPVHTLRVTVPESENNPNSKARLGPKELKEIGKETNMHPGQGVAPEFMKRSSLGAFGPVVTKIKKKKKRDTGKDSAGQESSGDATGSHGHVIANQQENRELFALTGRHDYATCSGLLQVDVVLE